jgi:septum formation protein
VILASRSPRRLRLLRELGLDPVVIHPNIDESIPDGADPQVAATELSRMKASAVSADRSGSVIIAADTMVLFEGNVLGKPSSEDEALSMLGRLVGNWHEVVTGVTAMDVDANVMVSSSERTRVHMRQLDDEALEWYVSTGEPMDKAGAYGIQGIGSGIVDRVEGCFYNVVGLPVPRLCLLLEKDLGLGRTP